MVHSEPDYIFLISLEPIDGDSSGKSDSVGQRQGAYLSKEWTQELAKRYMVK